MIFKYKALLNECLRVQQINELETKMQICTSSLEEETNCKVQLEQSLEERIKVIKQLNDRVIALEENKQSLAVEVHQFLSSI